MEVIEKQLNNMVSASALSVFFTQDPEAAAIAGFLCNQLRMALASIIAHTKALNPLP